MAIPVIYNLRSVKARGLPPLWPCWALPEPSACLWPCCHSLADFAPRWFLPGLRQCHRHARRGHFRNDERRHPGFGQDSQDEPGVARVNGEPVVTSEVVVVAPFPLRATGTDANVQIRGVSANVLTVRKMVKIVQGRMFSPGLSELIAGRNASSTYSGLTVGNKVTFGGGTWTVVGIFDAGGSAFDSEVWCDSRILSDVYKRPNNIFQSVTVHLTSPDAFQGFKDAVVKDPRLDVDVSREIDYYAKQSQMMTRLITVLGGLVAAVMGIGAVFGALNTMYSAVSERGREIAVMRALGFGAVAVVFSFLVEALLISFVGGAIGCVAVLPLNGFTTGAMNWQTFSHLAFAFKITPDLLVGGIIFALAMGVAGGLLPAIHAALRPISVALRSL